MTTLPEQFSNVVLLALDAFGTPFGKRIARQVRACEWNEVAHASADPRNYYGCDIDHYFLDAAVAGLLKKCEDLPVDQDALTELTLKGWLASEAKCDETNQRFISYRANPSGLDRALHDFQSLVRKYTSRLLGPCPDWAELEPGFSNGASYDLSELYSLLPDKIASKPTVTDNALRGLVPWMETSWYRGVGVVFSESPYDAWSHLAWDDFSRLLQVGDIRENVELVPGNRHSTVPKSAKIRRNIGVEPLLNLYLQLGCGRFMRKRLNRWNLLLDESQEHHQRLAREGSLRDDVATIDLSSASDEMAYSMVQEYLPYEWFEMLSAVRSPRTRITHEGEEKWIELNKFSSMGNGATFDLETTLFAATCYAVAEMRGVTLIPLVNFSVYGDDIIVPKEIGKDVIAALKWQGFTINVDKSFLSGSFKESCGGDYMRGYNVRPVSIEREPRSSSEWVTLHNKLYRLQCRLDALCQGRRVDLSASMQACVDSIPKSYRLWGPPVVHGKTSPDIYLFSENPEQYQLAYHSCQQTSYIRGLTVLPPKIDLSADPIGRVHESGAFEYESDPPRGRARDAMRRDRVAVQKWTTRTYAWCNWVTVTCRLLNIGGDEPAQFIALPRGVAGTYGSWFHFGSPIKDGKRVKTIGLPPKEPGVQLNIQF